MEDKSHNPYCLPCIYYGKNTRSCDYILMEDRRRPCPGGEGCTERRTKKEVGRKLASKASWDTALGMQMWLEGKKDREIAEHFGIASNTVTTCRRKYWEKHVDPSEKKSEPPQAIPVQPAADPAPQPPKVSMSTPDGVYSILEEATKTKSGIEAICTADAILCLWNWDSADDLRRARAAINHLIKRLEG